MHQGDTQEIDSEYIQNDTCSIFAFVEPLECVCHINVQPHRTAIDRTEEFRYLMDVSYPDHNKLIFVIDNLNTHALFSLYKAFSAPVACRSTKKLEIHYTPKHES